MSNYFKNCTPELRQRIRDHLDENDKGDLIDMYIDHLSDDELDELQGEIRLSDQQIRDPRADHHGGSDFARFEKLAESVKRESN